MTDSVFDLVPSDEGRHSPGAEQLWGESWYLDWGAADASYGGYVRLGLYPNLGRAWWWIALVGADAPTVLVVDHDLPCPEPGAPCAIDSASTSVALAWPEPLARFTVRSRATGIRLSDPADAFRGPTSVPPGDPVPVAVDLTWESRAEPFPYAMTTRYEISSWVTGTVAIGDETIAVDCAGQRDHSWGVRDWWLFPWNWTSGHLDDGSWFHAARSTIPGLELFATGYTVTPAGALTPATVVTNEVDLDPDQLPAAARQQIGPVEFTTEPVGHAPILLVAPDGRITRFPRALCRYTTTDGRHGTGWTEYNLPQL
jgi:hypothetical protein